MKTKQILKAETRFNFYLRNLSDEYHKMKDEGLSYWSISSSFVDVLLYGNYFDSADNLDDLMRLGFEYFDCYEMTNDPWYKKGELSFFNTFLWNKYIFYRLQNKEHEEIANQFYENILKYYESKKIFKSDSADWENFMFLSWFLNKSIVKASAVNEVCHRKLLAVLIDFEFNKSIDNKLLLNNFKKEFNRNRNNILFNVESGIPQIFYYYTKSMIIPSIKDICKAQLEGLR